MTRWHTAEISSVRAIKGAVEVTNRDFVNLQLKMTVKNVIFSLNFRLRLSSRCALLLNTNGFNFE